MTGMTKKILFYAGALTVAMVAGFLVFHFVTGGTAITSAAEINWRDLGEYDYVTHQASDLLKNQNGKMVKIPGFMVPLDDNMKSVSQFLLVPTPQACIHVPPPPPNQMVLVEMQEDGTEVMMGPVWVYGEFDLHPKDHMYGQASFILKGVRIEPYK